MAQSKAMKKSVLTPSTITPPSINRQHSYNAPSHTSPTQSTNGTAADAKNILAQMASRAASPRRTYPIGSPLASPTEAPHMERRRSWEDCVHQRDGYISFPDFDQLKQAAEGCGQST